MKNKYILLIDVDGTLIKNGEKEISSNILESLKYAKQKGHILVIATGRSLKSTTEIKEYDNFNYIACLMGSVIFSVSKNQIVYKDEDIINNQYIKPLIQYFIKENKTWAYKNEKEDKTTYDVEKYGNRFKAIKVSEGELMADLHNNKIIQLVSHKDLIDNTVIQQFNELDFVYVPNHYDITKKGQSKANIVEYFKNQYPKYQIVAIGDSNNDIPMLEKADISIAMGNANNDVKNICDYITKSVQEDGVSYAINEILKI